MESQTERRHRQILACTFDQLSQNGYGGTTAKKLAASAEISDTLIFKYFKTLDNLYREVIETRLRTLFSVALPAGNVSLNDFLLAYLQSFEKEVVIQREKEVRLYVNTVIERPDLSPLLPAPDESGAWLELVFRLKEKRLSQVEFKLQFLRSYLDGRLLRSAAGRPVLSPAREELLVLLDFFAA